MARDEGQKQQSWNVEGRRLAPPRWKEYIIVVVAVSNLIVIVIRRLSKMLCQIFSGG